MVTVSSGSADLCLTAFLAGSAEGEGWFCVAAESEGMGLVLMLGLLTTGNRRFPKKL